MDIAGGVRGLHPAFLAQEDTACVDHLVDHEGRDTGEVLSVDDGPVDRGRAAVLRQKGGVEVERAHLGHLPDHLRKHPEADDHEEVRFPGRKGFEEGRILELVRLQDGNPVRDGVFLDGALVDLEPASAGLVGHGHDAYHLVAAPLGEGVERGHGEFRRAHVDDAGLLEQGHDLAEEFAAPGLEGVQVEGLLPDGHPGEEHADRYQDEG